MGGPSNFIVNQSPNPWILGFEILDLDFGLDNKYNFVVKILTNLPFRSGCRSYQWSEATAKQIFRFTQIDNIENYPLICVNIFNSKIKPEPAQLF